MYSFLLILMEEVLREKGFPKDIAQYIYRIVETMYLNEWRIRMIAVHDTLDGAMYCVKWSVEQIKRSGAPAIIGCSWTGYSLTRYHLLDGTRRGLTVHALDTTPDHPEDDMCIECGHFPF